MPPKNKNDRSLARLTDFFSTQKALVDIDIAVRKNAVFTLLELELERAEEFGIVVDELSTTLAALLQQDPDVSIRKSAAFLISKICSWGGSFQHALCSREIIQACWQAFQNYTDFISKTDEVKVETKTPEPKVPQKPGGVTAAPPVSMGPDPNLLEACLRVLCNLIFVSSDCLKYFTQQDLQLLLPLVSHEAPKVQVRVLRLLFLSARSFASWRTLVQDQLVDAVFTALNLGTAVVRLACLRLLLRITSVPGSQHALLYQKDIIGLLMGLLVQPLPQSAQVPTDGKSSRKPSEAKPSYDELKSLEQNKQLSEDIAIAAAEVLQNMCFNAGDHVAASIAESRGLDVLLGFLPDPPREFLTPATSDTGQDSGCVDAGDSAGVSNSQVNEVLQSKFMHPANKASSTAMLEAVLNLIAAVLSSPASHEPASSIHLGGALQPGIHRYILWLLYQIPPASPLDGEDITEDVGNGRGKKSSSDRGAKGTSGKGSAGKSGGSSNKPTTAGKSSRDDARKSAALKGMKDDLGPHLQQPFPSCIHAAAIKCTTRLLQNNAIAGQVLCWEDLPSLLSVIDTSNEQVVRASALFIMELMYTFPAEELTSFDAAIFIRGLSKSVSNLPKDVQVALARSSLFFPDAKLVPPARPPPPSPPPTPPPPPLVTSTFLWDSLGCSLMMDGIMLTNPA